MSFFDCVLGRSGGGVEEEGFFFFSLFSRLEILRLLRFECGNVFFLISFPNKYSLSNFPFICNKENLIYFYFFFGKLDFYIFKILHYVITSFMLFCCFYLKSREKLMQP